MEPQTELERYCQCRIAIIEVRPGETKEGAWSRHLAKHPEDSYANVKIFNRGGTSYRFFNEHRVEAF
jgi:hypothetical protein